MADVQLHVTENGDGVTTLSGTLASDGPIALHYETRTGALLRIGGEVAGAFDREHGSVTIEGAAGAALSLEVEERSLPTNGLPSGAGLQWWWLNVLARQAPSLAVDVEPAQSNGSAATAASGVPLIGHSHLDVAWLWTYAQTERKALRTFAIARNLLLRYPEFVFSQSQPQLYEFVQQNDPQFFGRIVALAKEGRFDPSIAALWVEPDCNLPSGESLLRQMLFAHDYCTQTFGVTPQVAWLPDTFGFANTLPTLLDHAGIAYFVTTKLQWNDTTRFPHHQFLWRGPDGSQVLGAMLASYEGGVDDARLALAQQRCEPLVAGFGDGGGGVTAEMIEAARSRGYWVRPLDWLESLKQESAELPVVQDELYLEYHRGVYTTHHGVKAHNARLERKLAAAEEAAAWCIAVRAPGDLNAAFRAQLDAVWKIVLRNQFHDVLPGTSVAAVYEDVRVEYEAAGAIVDAISKGAASVLPRGRQAESPGRCEPVAGEDGDYHFENESIGARVNSAGVLCELALRGGRNVISQGNILAFYPDRPKKWEAWNIDAGYDRRRRHPKRGTPSVRDGELCIPFSFKDSTFLMRIFLVPGEAFLRVALECDWKTQQHLLRVENWLPIRAERVTYGTPHGTISRSASASTPEERAKFEVPGQRFALARDSSAAFALLSLDTYGWSARTLPKGGIHVGHSLLRGTTWPDPTADQGHNSFAYAFAPAGADSIGALEHLWERFAHESRVRLFVSEQEHVIVAAVKPAQDGRGVIVRIRECDGTAGIARIRCGGRVRGVEPVDAMERPCAGTVSIEAETLVAPIGPFALRSFRAVFV